MKLSTIVGIAALFLATGTGYADKCTSWQCGKIEVEACVSPGGLRTGPDTADRERDVTFHLLNPPIRLHRFEMKDIDNVPMLNGKYCKKINDTFGKDK